VPVAACGQPAFAQYRRGGAEAWGLVVLETTVDAEGAPCVASITTFLDVATHFPRYGLPLTLPPR
jgi:RNA polymerase sigma-70 factor (ECF subfamily)